MRCAIGALLIGALAAWRKWSATVLDWRSQARWAVVSAAAVMTLIAGFALAAQHADHYAGRAEANGRSLLAEVWARPVCSGSASDRADASR